MIATQPAPTSEFDQAQAEERALKVQAAALRAEIAERYRKVKALSEPLRLAQLRVERLKREAEKTWRLSLVPQALRDDLAAAQAEFDRADAAADAAKANWATLRHQAAAVSYTPKYGEARDLEAAAFLVHEQRAVEKRDAIMALDAAQARVDAAIKRALLEQDAAAVESAVDDLRAGRNLSVVR